MIYYNRSSSERFQVPRRRSLTHSSRTRRRRSHSGEHAGSAKACMSNGSTPPPSTCAHQLNDSMIYLDGPQVYACAKCRTHLTSHDEIISKSFHGRHGRAFLFDHCVNVDIGPAEERPLMTGLHSVCDIFCKRCKGMVGWTYIKAYESSQKYKEGKFILEKINLHLEASDHYRVAPPPGEKNDRFRARSISWGGDRGSHSQRTEVYEYGDSCSHGLGVTDSKFTSGGDLSEQYTPLKTDCAPRR
mmetsp:Transcript_39915/g.96304  ORF Transcript_39915/g.96304 Transcript_39915/m.96304 type:complete len:244 (-) Transcript_39915:126-857(-)